MLHCAVVCLLLCQAGLCCSQGRGTAVGEPADSAVGLHGPVMAQESVRDELTSAGVCFVCNAGLLCSQGRSGAVGEPARTAGTQFQPQSCCCAAVCHIMQGFVAVKDAVQQWVDLLSAQFVSLEPVTVQDFHPDEVDDDIIKG